MTSGPYGDTGYPPGDPAAGGSPQPGDGYPGPYPVGAGYPGAPPPPGYPPPPPGYGYPGGYGYPQPRNGMGTAGMVLGIIGLIFCWMLWVGWTLNILAIIFGGVGVHRANHGLATNKSSALAGLILGIIGLVLGLGLWLLIGSMAHGHLIVWRT